MKKILILAAAWLAVAGNAFSQSIYGEFMKAYASNDHSNCVKYGKQLAQAVDEPNTLYKLSQCLSQNDLPEESLEILNRLADLGLSYKIAENSRLEKLRGEKQYPGIVAKFEKNLRPVNHSENAFGLSENDLIPEGLASRSDGSKFYLGSLAKNKIVEYSVAGGERNFIESGRNGLWSVVGMKISPDNKELWVCSFSENGQSNGFSGLFGFELASGKLIAKYVRDNQDGPHLFNDLVIARDGRIYFTDSKGGKVLGLNKETKQIESNFNHRFIYPNGIALDEKTEILFVADFGGLNRIDLKTGHIAPVKSDNLTYLNNIDGLYLYEGSLVAIQNTGEGADRIARFFLDQSQTTITGVKILQSFHPDFAVPTTGAIVGDEFYYIANSFVTSLKPDGTIENADKLKKPIIKKINLKAASK